MARGSAVILVVIGLIHVVSTAAGRCPEPLGHWGYGSHDVAAWYGELALIPSGPRLLVVDFRLDASHAIVGEVRVGGIVIALEVEGTVAYAAVRGNPGSADELLVSIDLSDPASPKLVGRVAIARAMSDVAVDGTVAYATSLSEGLVLVDVSNPASLRRLSSMPALPRPESVVARGGFAYVGNPQGLTIVDVTSPADPSIVAIQSIRGDRAGLALSESHLFVLADDELVVFDLADPARPVRRGAYVPSGSATALAVSGSRAYLTQYRGTGSYSVELVDVADPDDLRQVGEYSPYGRIFHIAAGSNGVLLSMGTAGSQQIDVSDSTAPRRVACLPPPAPPGDIEDVAVDGDRGLAYLADTGGLFWSSPPFGRLRILDVSEADGPRELTSVGFDEPARRVATFGDHVLVLRGEEEITSMTLEVVDVSDPSRPEVVGHLSLSGPPWGELVVSGDHAFVTDGSLNIVELADPTNPRLVSRTFTGAGFGNGLAVVGDRAYVAGESELCVVDVSDPTDPDEIGCTPTGGSAGGVAVHDRVAFVSVGLPAPRPPWTDELRVFDATDETAPAEIGALKLWGLAGRVSLDGDLLFVEVVGRGLLVVDVSDPRTPAPVGLARVDASGSGSGGRLYTAAGLQGLDVLDTSSCAVPAPSPDFVWSPGRPTLGEEVLLTDLSPGAPTSWTWDFGDGTTSSDQHPRHRFSIPGRNTVSLTASNEHGASSTELWVPVQSIADPLLFSWIVPAAAHGNGEAGTRWRSDLTLWSTRPEGSEAVVYLMKRGRDNTLGQGSRIVLPQGVTTFEDVVATVFGETKAQGAVFITSTSGLGVSSKTFTLSDEGTYGQFIPAIDEHDRSQVQTLIQLTQNDEHRTNLGIVNRLGTPLTVQAQLYSADGIKVAETTYDVEPFGHRQVDEFIAGLTDEPFPDGHVTLSGGQWADFLCYASTVDNLTGDPAFIRPSVATDEPLWIVAVAHVAGRNGTLWRSDLEVCADATADAEYRLELLTSGRANLEPLSESFALDAGHCFRYRDVVHSVLGAATTGALRVVPESGRVFASSRTFTRRPDGGTHGQFIAALPESEATPPHTVKRLAPVSQSSEPEVGFRTNVGLVNAAGIPIVVTLRVLGPGDLPLHEEEIELEPFEHRQLDRYLEVVGIDDDLVDTSILVQTLTGGARFHAYASVVDNASGDAVFLPAQ